MHHSNSLHVAAGVIYDSAGKILIAKRPEHLHQGGLWEFPGGKLESGETARDALGRELREELNIEVQAAEPLIRVRYRYPERSVLLDVWRVDRFSGDPRGVEGQPIIWVAPEKLDRYVFPAGNVPIVNAVRLPTAYGILEDDSGSPEELWRRLRIFGQRGIKLMQLRARRLSLHQFEAMGASAVSFCRDRGIDLLINGNPATARRLGAGGVHLRSSQLMETEVRPPGLKWVAASAHNRDEILQAERIGVDFIVLGPVRTTASHPAIKPLGWVDFAELADGANIPVFALGGLSMADLAEAKSRGAQGIAGIRGFLE